MIDQLLFVIRNYFGFSKVEANGFIILIALLFLLILYPVWKPLLFPAPRISPLESAALDSSLLLLQKAEFIDETPRNTKRKSYQNKKASSNFESKKGSPSSPTPARKTFQISPFDLNKADTTTLRQIRGIGPVLSNRIVKYRDLLGGFHSVDQLNEVYGLKPEVIERLLQHASLNSKVYTRLNLNELNSYELGRHPYLDRNQAEAIYNYRKQHGKFKELNELLQLHRIDSTTYVRILPYLTL